MSNYTTEVRYICENFADLDESVGYNSVNTVIATAQSKIFENYPIFEESYREILNSKILKHYYTREIGLEVVGLWLLKLNTKMGEIMPYYNQLYNSALLDFNPLYNVELTREHTTDNTGSQNVVGSYDDTKKQELTSDSSNAYSDTPQGGLSNVKNLSYLTSATILESEDNSETTTKGNQSSTSNVINVENFIESVKGKDGTQSYSSLLLEFRETLLNIDMLVINELTDLFLNIY